MAETTTTRPMRRGGISRIQRVVDYIFGRNTLIGLASLMLLAIAGYATWHGMKDFIIGVSATPVSTGSSDALSLPNEVLVIIVTAALTFLMWLALRETFGAGRTIKERLVTLPLYLFLALWSIGFGYGFWWSLIAGAEATRTSLSSLQEDARDAAGAVAARIDAVRSQLESVVSWSESQMQREESSGGSCGQPSGAGRGPLYNARRSVRDGVATLRDNINRSWVGPIQEDIEQLRRSAAAIEGTTPEERQRRFEAMASDIRGRARNVATRSNELGRSTATEMRALADSVSVQPNQARFSCYDPTLAQRLRQAADQSAEPANLRLREAVFTEGPAGVANAIKNLWANIGTYASGLFSYIASGGNASVNWTASGEPITGRDMIALLATIGIDLGLLALAIINPPAHGPVRFRLPSAEVTNHLRSAFRTAFARAPDTNLEWVRRHFIHHNGFSYLVIPNLYRVARADTDEGKKEEQRALVMNHLAGVFHDLHLVRPLTARELKGLGKGERGDSPTDLTPYRQEHMEQIGVKEDPKQPLRKHGLLSKAQRALDIADWSPEAQRDVEIFQLVDVEGLTPLFEVLNRPTLDWDGERGKTDATPSKGSTA